MKALAAFGLAILLGAAFMRQGYEHHDAQRWLAATARADAAAAALEHEVVIAFDAVRQGTSVVTAEIGAIDKEDWQAMRRSPSPWSGPVRGEGGARKMVARVGAAEAADAHYGVFDLDALLSAAGLPRLAQEGYLYRLSRSSDGSAAILQSAQGRPGRAVARTLPAANWTLEVAPAGPAVGISTLLLQGLLVLLMAWVAFVATREVTHERQVLEDRAAASLARQRQAVDRLAEEILQREALEKQFSHASFHDASTGLATRRYLVSRLEAALRRRRSGGGHVAVAVFEADRVRAISDSLGVAVSDELITQIARRLEALAAGPERLASRIGDADFAIAFGEVASHEAALDALREVDQALRKPFEIAGHRLHIRTHAGVAFSDAGYEHPDDLLRGAQIAMSHARVQQIPMAVFDPTTEEQLVSRQQIEASLHGVAERGELRANYQPIVDLASGELVGFEALVRWQHPVEGLIAPNLFIPLAEESGLIVPITRWMLREACGQAREWRDAYPGRAFYVSVNLSARDMRLQDLPEYVQHTLQEHDLPAAFLRLEVTEGSMIENVRVAAEMVARLRELGIRILLDDFGTGYSSLSYLHRFPIDYLKIDQSFVRRLTAEDKSLGIVRAILYLAEAMGVETVAEGIETAEAQAVLLGMRCRYGQGYLFSRPVDRLAAAALLGGVPPWGKVSRLNKEVSRTYES